MREGGGGKVGSKMKGQKRGGRICRGKGKWKASSGWGENQKGNRGGVEEGGGEVGGGSE